MCFNLPSLKVEEEAREAWRYVFMGYFNHLTRHFTPCKQQNGPQGVNPLKSSWRVKQNAVLASFQKNCLMTKIQTQPFNLSNLCANRKTNSW